MGKDSSIQWTHHTFNPWRGCTKVDTLCSNCYAETMSRRNPGTLGVWGPNGTRVVASESKWREPLKWDRDAAKVGERHRVFCASLADVFESWQGPMVDSRGNPFAFELPDGLRHVTMDDVRERLFGLIEATPNLDWLLLTKRPERIRECWPRDTGRLDNVWLGTSAGTQATADRAIPELLKCRDLAPVLFVSAEPLLEHVDFTAGCWLTGDGWETPIGAKLDWIITGGESGSKARPCDLAWLRSIRDQCNDAKVAYFCKQLGSRPVDNGKLIRFRDSHGGDMSEWSEDLRVREFPMTAAAI